MLFPRFRSAKQTRDGIVFLAVASRARRTFRPSVRAMVLRAARTPLVPAELPLPEPGPGEVRVRVAACGVCRTDLHVADGDLPRPKLPLVLGHEVVGRVDAVGAGVTRQQAVTAVRAGGTVILTGLHEEQSALNFGDVIRREVVLRGSFAYSPANFAEGLDWLRLPRSERCSAL